MTPSAFQRQRNRIELRFPVGRKRADAMRHLVADAAAAIIIIDGKAVGYRLPSGAIVCVKRRYATDVNAGQDLARIQGVSVGHIPTRAYHCARCQGFHLTSQARKQ